MNLDQLRRFTVARNFFRPTTLQRALQKMEFVQADPIRAPARAQDLILRHRVKDYRAGDLERRYSSLAVEEDVFVNYGYVTRSLQALMHPRLDSVADGWAPEKQKRVELLLGFVRDRGVVHPREVDEHFSHGRVTNYWGGSSNATTHLLDEMHYRGLLRIVRRARGIRIYAEHQHGPVVEDSAERQARIDALVDVVVRIYAPLPGASLTYYVRRLRYAAPQWSAELTKALQRARERLSHARVEGVDWYWLKAEDSLSRRAGVDSEIVRLLAPFDPLVHDRTRFEKLWNWVYRFEAYTPVPKRKLGYYAMPLLWRDRVIGWANVAVKNNALECEFGYAASPPRDRAFKRELGLELDRLRTFLALR
jgi:uncharacterized protein YcaQ